MNSGTARWVWLWVGLCLVTCWQPASAFAHVERFAVIVGSDRGQSDEAVLKYAQADARKVHATLREIGGFAPFNTVLLEGGDAQSFRETLIDLNDRVRAARSRPGTQVVLFVYFSGHADAQDLHLGTSRLSIAELSKLVRGSAADFRLLVLDACRSGTLTRGKGGRTVQPFDIPAPSQLSGEGLAFLTASADNELAQESDEVRGSFFTHALVSGLLGAADRDRDGNVVLDEAYQYAYDNTLRASSRSASGLQHPTFFYDLRGQGQLVLTRPFAAGQGRGTLELPRAATYLVFRGSAQGQVAAEVTADDPIRMLSLSPGSYFVRGRTESHVLEGAAQVEPGRVTRVDAEKLTRLEYAHLVRKGHDGQQRAHTLEALWLARSPLPNGDAFCYGAQAGYRLDFASWGLLMRGGGCVSVWQGEHLSGRTRTFDLSVRGLHAFDLGARCSIDTGFALGVAYFNQRFDTSGSAPNRDSWAGLGEAVLGFNVEIARGAFVTTEAAGQAFLMPMLDQRTRQTEVRAAGAVRLGIGGGARF